MTAQNVIDYAKYGELKQLAIKDDVPAVLSYINLAIIEVYKRFNLKISEEIVTLSENITEYTMPGDFMLLSAVYDENGEMLPINDEDDPYSILTPSYNTIQVPNAADGASLSVMYKPEPTFIVNVTDVVPIPIQVLECLLHYIGYRGHGSVSGDLKTENNSHYMRFEASVQRVYDLGLITVDTVPTSFQPNKEMP